MLANGGDAREEYLNFILLEQDVERVLDAIELAARSLERYREMNNDDRSWRGIKLPANEAIDELNVRMQQHSIGYQIENGRIIRIDSMFTHEEIIKSALHLFMDNRFASAEAEYLKAHESFRLGNYPEAVTQANSAFESCMKSICTIAEWDYPPKARATDLVKVLRKNNLFPDYLERSFEQLCATLQSGLPMVRNEDSSAHGLGPKKRSTPAYVASYCLHLAASKMIFLIESFKDVSGESGPVQGRVP